MRTLVVLTLAILLLPMAVAVVAQSHNVMLMSNIVRPGYEFARVQGINYLDVPLEILHWHVNAELGLSFAACELQPLTLPPGPFTTDIVVQCQTRSGFPVMFPTGTQVKVDSFTPDGTPANALLVDRMWIETRKEQPTSFPITPIGHAVLEEPASTAGTLLFMLGIGTIVILTLAIMFVAIHHED